MLARILALGVFTLLLRHSSGETAPPQLHRLELEAAQVLSGPVRLSSEDFVLELTEGAGFVALASGRPTALVLIGKGRIHFAPPISSERRQLSLFCGSPELSEAFDAAYVRFHPDDFETFITLGTLRREAGPADLRKRATALFSEEVRRSFALEGGVPNASTLSTLPERGDVLAEVRTTRLGPLAYARVGKEPEDIVLLDRSGGRTLVTYPSRAHGSASGLEYSDERGLPYEALSYDVSLDVDPERRSITGVARILVRALTETDTLSLRLDGGLSVTKVDGPSGPLSFLQKPASAALLVHVSPPLEPGAESRLEVAYSGWARPQELWREIGGEPPMALRAPAEEPLLLYSNRIYFFPQSPVRNHTPATLRVAVPRGYAALASGVPGQEGEAGQGASRVVFRAVQPVRYLSLLVGHFSQLEVARDEPAVALRVFADASSGDRARRLAPTIASILRFYARLAGEDPYPYLGAAVVAAPVPSGHSPAYLCVLGEPPDWKPSVADDDPAYNRDEPVFTVAHEIAHQWWGQGVGWRNYREQWLSEGLAQYFAALYVRESRGEHAFAGVLEWMQRWALRATAKGPVNLGVRVGQLDHCPTCFAAAVYDRSALVLHMLRGLLGEESFWRGLHLYAGRWKFRRASTGELERAFEEASGRDLSRFFEQWIRDDGVPTLEWSTGAAGPEARGRLRLHVRQIGETYELPLCVAVDSEDGVSRSAVVNVSCPVEDFVLDLPGDSRGVRINPDHAALCELRRR
jgi:hypothetical protein